MYSIKTYTNNTYVLTFLVITNSQLHCYSHNNCKLFQNRQDLADNVINKNNETFSYMALLKTTTHINAGIYHLHMYQNGYFYTVLHNKMTQLTVKKSSGQTYRDGRTEDG